MKISRQTFILFLLFLLNFLARFSLISKGPYHADCLFLAVQAEATLHTLKIHYLQGTGLPLTAIVGAIFIGLGKWIGTTDIVMAVNFMNVLLASVCVPIFYLLLRKLFDDKAALVGSVVLSLNTIFLPVSTFGNSHILAILFFFLGLLFIFQYFHSEGNVTYFLAGICFGLMGAARLQDLFVILPAIAFLFCVRPGSDKKRRYMNLILFFLIIFMVTSAFYIPFLVNKNYFSMANSFQQYKTVIFQALERVNLNSFRIVLYWMFQSISFVGCVGSAIGLWLMYRGEKKLFASFIALFIVPTFMLVSLWWFFRYTAPRMYLIPAIILIIPLSYAFSALNKRNTKLFNTAFILLIFLLVFNNRGIYETVKFRHDHALLSDFYRWIGQVTEPGANIIERDHSLFIKFYAQRIPLGAPITLFEAKEEDLKHYKEHINLLLESHIPVYVTETGLTGYPERLKFNEFMQSNFEFELVGQRDIEDWYGDVLIHSVMENSLYRLKKKQIEPI
ncbi:MAG: glycosyltransferase family 39 protein [Candidatus Omnitrophica bacterium]|nr:glycosyltransferase family 39 protein [Candidatus Omnitrophota bacterium]